MTLLEDKENYGVCPACGPDFTCTAPVTENGDMNKDCVHASWRCDGQNDCPDKSNEVECPTCRVDQFSCQSGECFDKALICHDEADCCKRPGDFQCAINKLCISAKQINEIVSTLPKPKTVNLLDDSPPLRPIPSV
ncbi:very low-density lipoprotein receptor-like [Drosophila miranda]|uniref:very low-density lipoprotein receptor-like n=1 Tax=Drosophila miranda TaxID=7229 RepID=UPI0007E61312|nr:very low-density lipoprotein receptor-like [Drosophila miranda]XP_017156925.1 very low-density lipoprotein receptor-like [Drosophila miranda]